MVGEQGFIRASKTALAALLALALVLPGSLAVTGAEEAHAAVAAASLSDGWVVQNGKTYYYKAGKKLTGKKKVEGAYYLFDKKGAMQKGLKKVGKRYYYFASNGVMQTGLLKIGKNYRFFASNGVMKTGTVKNGKVTYYISSKGLVEACKRGGSLYRPTGVKMPAYQAKEYNALLTARKVLASITSPGMSKSQKLRRCFNWVMEGYYHQYREYSNYAGWAADFANDHFKRKFNGYRMGCCVSDAAALGYLALAIGYTDVSVGVDSITGSGGHSSTKINGRYYDPLFAEAKDFWSYYGSSNGHHFRSVKLMVPSGANGYATSRYIGQQPTGLAKAKSSKNGLVKSGKYLYYYRFGQKVTNSFITTAKGRYYFTANGRAATGPCKVKGTRYVFSATGKLLTGSKTRVVTVSGQKYRVTKSGTAKAGYSENNTRLYLENGRMATGLCIYKGALYRFSDKGAYLESDTLALRAAARKGKDATELLALIGTPLKKNSYTGCQFVLDDQGNEVFGKDLIYYFRNATVTFLKGDDGKTYLMGFSSPE